MIKAGNRKLRMILLGMQGLRALMWQFFVSHNSETTM